MFNFHLFFQSGILPINFASLWAKISFPLLSVAKCGLDFTLKHNLQILSLGCMLEFFSLSLELPIHLPPSLSKCVDRVVLPLALCTIREAMKKKKSGQTWDIVPAYMSQPLK
jgi:hypothetical protein